MATNEELGLEIKKIIVESLALEDISPEEIDSQAPLFVEGLGLDSIDALELAMALDERFGVSFEDDPDENQRIFFSVETLVDFVATHQPA